MILRVLVLIRLCLTLITPNEKTDFNQIIFNIDSFLNHPKIVELREKIKKEKAMKSDGGENPENNGGVESKDEILEQYLSQLESMIKIIKKNEMHISKVVFVEKIEKNVLGTINYLATNYRALLDENAELHGCLKGTLALAKSMTNNLY